VQQGSDLSADGVGGATFLDAGTVPLLHVVNIDLEKYSETIDLSV
jgi:hypothetical protein